MRCDWPNRPRQMVDLVQGKPALTRFQRLKSRSTHGRVKLEPETGRSHQLRVHMAALGHLILGCEFYAHQQAFDATKRLHLHASQLHFYHPVTNELLAFTSPPSF